MEAQTASTELGEGERDKFGQIVRNALPEWNFDDSDVSNWFNSLAASKRFTLVVVDDWFARKELDGATVFWGEKEHETEDAKLFKQASDFQDRNERQGHYENHIGEVWVPKSVIRATVTVKAE